MKSRIALSTPPRTGDSREPYRGSNRKTSTLLGAVVLTCAAIGIGVAWRLGYPQRTFRILWDGDREARAKARQLGEWAYSGPQVSRNYFCDSKHKNVAGAREYIDELTTDVDELSKLVGDDSETIGREAARKQHAKLGESLGKSVTDVLVHLDKVTGDDQVRAARRAQVERALALGVRVAQVVGEAAADR